MEKHQILDALQRGIVSRSASLNCFLSNLVDFADGLMSVIDTILDRGFINKGSGSYYYSLYSQLVEVMGHSEAVKFYGLVDVAQNIIDSAQQFYTLNQISRNNTDPENGLVEGCMLYDPAGSNVNPVDHLRLQSALGSNRSLVFMRNKIGSQTLEFFLRAHLISQNTYDLILPRLSNYTYDCDNFFAVMVSPGYLRDLVANLHGYVPDTERENEFIDSPFMAHPLTVVRWYLPTILNLYRDWLIDGNDIGEYLGIPTSNAVAFLPYERGSGSQLAVLDATKYVPLDEINSVWSVAATLKTVLRAYPIEVIKCGAELAKGFATLASEFSHAAFDSSSSRSDMLNWVYNYIMSNMMDKCYSDKLLKKQTIDPVVNQFINTIL